MSEQPPETTTIPEASPEPEPLATAGEAVEYADPADFPEA